MDGMRRKGSLKTHDGVYEGRFEANLRSGFGRFRWGNGETFEGEWRMGSKNGLGVWKSPDGSSYEGEWQLNMQHGRGKFTHAVSTYEGTFRNFLK